MNAIDIVNNIVYKLKSGIVTVSRRTLIVIGVYIRP